MPYDPPSDSARREEPSHPDRKRRSTNDRSSSPSRKKQRYSDRALRQSTAHDSCREASPKHIWRYDSGIKAILHAGDYCKKCSRFAKHCSRYVADRDYKKAAKKQLNSLTSDSQETIARLQQRIDELEKQVALLEDGASNHISRMAAMHRCAPK